MHRQGTYWFAAFWNYVLPLLPFLLFCLLYFQKYIQQKSIAIQLFLTLLIFMAAFSQEQIGVAVVGFTLMIGIWEYVKKNFNRWNIGYILACNRAKVAIIMDWENWWALSDAQAISRKFDYTEELLKYYRVFWEKGIEVDIISMDRELLDYQLVVAPTLYLHKKEYIHKVEAYVEAGGIYVTTYWSGVVNETDLCFIGERPHERLLGLSVDEIDVGNEYFPNTFSYKDGVYKAGVLREVVTLQTAKPLGTYLQDYNVNTPAITENAYGKGKAYYVAVQPDLEFLKEFLGDVIEEANVEANLTETLPYGVTVSKRSGKEQKDDVYFLQNFNRHPVKMVLNECYTNLITDEILTGSIKLQTYQCIVMQKK